MTDKELQQEQEIQRLQKKVQHLTKSYQNVSQELQTLKQTQIPKNPRRGRPSISEATKNQILFLRQSGNSIRTIAQIVNLSVGAVHKVIQAAAEKSTLILKYMDYDNLCTIIKVNYPLQKIEIINYTDDLLKRAFGINEHPTWEDFEDFLEFRCMPRTRYGIKEELRNLGLSTYDPMQIIEKTQGRLYDDHQWIQIERSV